MYYAREKTRTSNRLINEERYGFVRFKLVMNVEELLKRLSKIKFGEENLTMFIAYNRKNLGARGAEVNRNVGNKIRKESGWKIMDGMEALGMSVTLQSICEEQGLSNVEVKLLRGLEVLMVFDTLETATNILNSSEHGLRRWVHKLRRWNKHYILPGRLTRINIIGVPVSCWSESVFKKIDGLHRRVIGSSNCKLEGNQNLIVGKVQLHTINKGLIKEPLYVKLYEKKFKLDVIEEVGNVMEFEMKEKGVIGKNKIEHMETHKNEDENDIVVSKSSDDGTDSEDERGETNDGVGNGIRPQVNGGLADSDSKGCSISMKHVEEIGKIIRVSWAKAKNKKVWGVETMVREDEKEEDYQGLGEAGKKGWITTIIKEDLPDIIGENSWVNGSSKGTWCIFGDLNVVRGSEEGRNSQVNTRETTDFNDFINKVNLIEIPMGEESSLGDEVELETENKTLSKVKREAWMKARKSWVDKENGLKCMLRQKSMIKISVDDALLVEKEFTKK
nr:transposon TX1 [Tanacetum cinerariifolium]